MDVGKLARRTDSAVHPSVHAEHAPLTAQIEQTVKEADEGKFASDEQVAAMRARRWSRNVG